MLKFFLASLFILSNAFASFHDMEVIQYNDMSEAKGIALLKSVFEEGRYLNRTQTYAFEKIRASRKKSLTAAVSNYSNGDYVILWGVGASAKDQNITEIEYKNMWRIMSYLSQSNFRVIMNVRSTADDLADALASKTSSVVLFSSHGNQQAFYDFNLNPVPQDIFKHRAENVYQVIISACYSQIALRTYEVPEDLKVFSWYGLTDPNELINFLFSPSYTGFEGKESR